MCDVVCDLYTAKNTLVVYVTLLVDLYVKKMQIMTACQNLRSFWYQLLIYTAKMYVNDVTKFASFLKCQSTNNVTYLSPM